MNIQSIDILNYRGIKQLHVDLQRGINLLIGSNGAGKTSLLNALALSIHEPLTMLSGFAHQQIDIDEVHQTTEFIGDTVVNTEFNYPVQIDTNLIWNDNGFLVHYEKVNEASYTRSKDSGIAAKFKELISEASSRLPILCFLPAQRGKLKYHKVETINISAQELQRSQGYQESLYGAQNIDRIQQWCIQMDFAEYQKKRKIQEYSTFQSIVSKFASCMDEKAINPKLYYSSDKASLVYSDGKNEYSLYQLSDGYQAVLCMAIELAYRAVLLNPNMDNISEIRGVVLIDEIEMHLHPEWQWKILDALENTFPKVQFIVATHSPIILSSAKNATLLLMKSPNEVVELDNAYGYRIDDVLSIPQGSISQPAAVSRYYDRIEEIIEDGHKEDLEKILEEAREEFKNSPEVYAGIKEFAEVNQWVENA